MTIEPSKSDLTATSLKEFDRLDRRLLYALDCNSRQSLSKIARTLRLGSDLVEYRAANFVKRGLISRFSPVINPAALGFTIYKIYLKHRMGTKVLHDFIRKASNAASTYWLMEGYGCWDLLLSIAARDPVDFEQKRFDAISQFGEYILELSVFTLVSITRYPKRYLVESSKERLSWSSQTARVELTPLDRAILNELSRNCRAPITSVAQKLGTSAAVVDHRIERLENQGIILGYRIQFDYTRIKLVLFKVFLELRDFSTEFRAVLERFCASESTVTCLIFQIGSFSAEFEVEAPSYEDFVIVMERFRDRCGDGVSRTEYMLVKRDYYHRVPS